MDYPELPKGHTFSILHSEKVWFDADQMRVYVDADRAQRTAPQVEAAPVVSADLLAAARTVLDGHDRILPIMAAYMGSLGITDAWGDTCEASDGLRAAIALAEVGQPTQAAPVQQPVPLQRYEPEIWREDRIRMEPDADGDWVKWVEVAPLYAAAQPVEVQRVGLTDEESAELFQANEDFCDQGDTAVAYGSLMRFASLGLLKCTRFTTTAEGNRCIDDYLARIQPAGEKGGA
jgi:hypothetical protein